MGCGARGTAADRSNGIFAAVEEDSSSKERLANANGFSWKLTVVVRTVRAAELLVSESILFAGLKKIITKNYGCLIYYKRKILLISKKI